MSKNRNTRERSEAIAWMAQSIVDQAQHDAADADLAKALRILWQKQLAAATGCTPFTARSHVVKALRRLRHENRQ